MKTVIYYRNVTTNFSETKEKNDRYDGSFTIKFDWDGRNPLLHNELKEVVKLIKPIMIDNGLKPFVVNTNFGEWKSITFQYVKKENTKFLFDTCVKLLTDILDKKYLVN